MCQIGCVQKKTETQFCSRKAALNSLELDIKIINLLMLSEGVRAVCMCKAPVVGHRLQIQENHTNFFVFSFT